MEFRVLGQVGIAVDGETLPLQTSLVALLALLLLHANNVISTDRLSDDLWGEQQPESGTAALQVRVSQLRKALGPDAERLRTESPGYVLDVRPGELDVDQFIRLTEAAAGAHPTVAAESLREALALWRGPALANLGYEAFAQPAIRRLEELRLMALESRIDADLARGHATELIPELEALVAEHPLRERLRGQLMLALYRAGRQVEALDTYRSARETLVAVLGLEPGAELRELEQAILRQDRSLESATAPSRRRSLLAAPSRDAAVEAVLSLALPLATKPAKEIVLARALASQDELRGATETLERHRQALASAGIAVRAAAFVSSARGDLSRFADEQGAELVIVDGAGPALDEERVRGLIDSAPCDVAVLIGGPVRPGVVLVPFVGADHDWTAIEIAAWAAGAFGTILELAGPATADDGRDASRLLANASIAVQRTLGVAATPLLLAPEPDSLADASKDAALVVLGLPDSWRQTGLGPARSALVAAGHAPIVIVRGGIRPGGLAPDATLTRFTWTLKG